MTEPRDGERGMARSPGEDAEWDRVRVEEDPDLWNTVVRTERCLRRHPAGDLACQPVFRRGGFWCGLCGDNILIMKVVKGN